jgi:hypothetical protein
MARHRLRCLLRGRADMAARPLNPGWKAAQQPPDEEAG